MKEIIRLLFGIEGILISLFTYYTYDVPNLIDNSIMKNKFLTSVVIVSSFGLEFAATAIGFLIIYCMTGALLTIGFAELYMVLCRKFGSLNKLYKSMRRVKYGIFYDEDKDVVLTIDKK